MFGKNSIIFWGGILLVLLRLSEHQHRNSTGAVGIFPL